MEVEVEDVIFPFVLGGMKNYFQVGGWQGMNGVYEELM